MTWAHTRLGSGKRAFLWLHGWGQTGASLTRAAGLLVGEGRHTLIDFPGFGNTPMLPEGAGTAAYADALESEWPNLVDQPSAVLVGHSFGARVAVQMAARHPDRVKAVIIIAGAGLKRRRSAAFKARAFALKLVGKMARLSDRLFGTSWLDAFRARFGSRDYQTAGALRPTFVAVVNEHLTNEAAQTRQPVLLIYGSDDTETPPEIGEAFYRHMPDARLVILSGYGHLDILDRGAYQIESHVRQFLETL